MLDQGRAPSFGSSTSELVGWSPASRPTPANEGAGGIGDHPLDLGAPATAATPTSDAKQLPPRSGGAATTASMRSPPRPRRKSSSASAGSGGAGATLSTGGGGGAPAVALEEAAAAPSKAEKKKAKKEKKQGGKPPGEIKKKPKLTKAERRALQEKQRAEKAERKAASATGSGKRTSAAPKSPGLRAQVSSGDGKISRTLVSRDKLVPLFSHLPQYERESSLSQNVGFAHNEPVHPAILRVGLKYGEGTIVGGNARCVAMLTAFKAFVADYTSPAAKALKIDLDKRLRSQIEFLTKCRPHSFSMGNAIRHVRSIISHIPPDWSDDQAKEEITYRIDRYVEERIRVADDAIVSAMVGDGDDGPRKIVKGDVILTYGRSHVVEMALKAAHERGIEFRVIVADARPRMEGKELLRRLERYGVVCSYVLLNAVSYVMKDVTKVVSGAAAMLNNGALVSRVGTAVVAMVANAYNKPFLVCCETYKFSSKVQLDAVCQNELGDPDELVATGSRSAAAGGVSGARTAWGTPLGHGGAASSISAAAGSAGGAGGASSSRGGRGAAAASGSGGGGRAADARVGALVDWRDIPGLRLLNLVYDLTPIEHVTMVITEFGIIPPTSVPVINRERRDDPDETDQGGPGDDLM